MKRLLRRLILTSALIALVVPLAFSQQHFLTILHTNDIHAGFAPHEAFWVRTSPKPLVGGFKELYFVSDSIRKTRPSTLFLDAGDVMTGDPITEREYRGAQGGALFAMMDMIGYDAWCPGNHDFDVSQDNLRKLTRIANFPTVCANLIDTAGAFPVNNRPYVLIEKNGLKIGIVGLISRELYDLVNQNNLVGLKVLSPAETLQKYINELAPETDIVIALTHEGVEDDSLLATEVHGLAVIVGGHSHTRLRSPKVINGVVIVQTGSNLENLGVLDLTIEGKKVTHYNGSLVQLWARPSRPSNALTALVDSMRSAIDKDYSEVLAVLKNDWVRSDSLSPIGTFIADAQRVAAGAEVGFMNNYGIRKDVPAGPLTKKDLFDVLPFRNILVTFQLSGKQLRDVLLNYLRKRATIQISGITARWRRNPDGDVSLVEVRVQGSPLDDTRMYPCAASDFFVGEAKHYLGVEIDHPIYLRQTVFEAVEQAVRKAKVISATVPNRIVQGQ